MDEVMQAKGWLLGVMLACALAAGWAGWRWGARLFPSPAWRTWSRVFLGGLLLLISFDALREVMASPSNNWNGPRLTPSFTLVSSYHSYYGPDAGPVSGNIYGPGLAIAYLPCVICSTPESAIRWGGVLSALWLFLPALLLLRRFANAQASDAGRWLLLTLGFYWLVTNPFWLRQVAFNVHADAPAIGLGLCACLFALRFAETSKTADLVLTALFTHSSVATKQTMLPLLVAIPAWLWLRGQRPQALKLLCVSAVVGVALWLVIALAYGWPAVWFNLVYIPGHHPWYETVGRFSWVSNVHSGHRLAVLGEAFVDYVLSNGWLWLVLLLAAIVGRKCLTLRRPDFKSPASLLLLAGVLLVPMSLLGRVKVGGDYNAFSYSAVFLSLAAVMLLYSAITRLPSTINFSLSPSSHRLILLATVAVFALSLVNGARSLLTTERETVCREQQAFEAMRSKPETVYFPWQPLAGLMAEGKLYHFSYGVYDRWLAGRPITPEHFQAHLPAHMEAVGVMKGSSIGYLRMAYLTNYSQVEIHAEMYLLKPAAKP